MHSGLNHAWETSAEQVTSEINQLPFHLSVAEICTPVHVKL